MSTVVSYACTKIWVFFIKYHIHPLCKDYAGPYLGGGGGFGDSNEPPPPPAWLLRSTRELHYSMYTLIQKQSLMIFTANLSTTTHSAAQVEWLLYVNCDVPHNQHQTSQCTLLYAQSYYLTNNITSLEPGSPPPRAIIYTRKNEGGGEPGSRLQYHSAVCKKSCMYQYLKSYLQTVPPDAILQK